MLALSLLHITQVSREDIQKYETNTQLRFINFINQLIEERQFHTHRVILLCFLTALRLHAIIPLPNRQLEAKTKILDTATGRPPSLSPCGDPCTNSIPPTASEGTKSSSVRPCSDTKPIHHTAISFTHPRSGRNTSFRSESCLHPTIRPLLTLQSLAITVHSSIHPLILLLDFASRFDFHKRENQILVRCRDFELAVKLQFTSL